MKNICSIVQDILPLYAENLANRDTKEFVEEHLEGCGDCRERLEDIKSEPIVDDSVTAPLKSMKDELKKRRIKLVVLTALILLTACFTLFGYLTSRQYIPYSDNIASVTTYGECASGVQAGADCRELLLITFDKKVTGYEVTEAIGEEPNDGHYYYIGAWTTKLDEIIGKQGVQNVVIERKDEKPITILYQQNNDTFDVILYNDDFSSESGMAMPRLALGYYVVISLALIAVLTVLIIIFRKKTKVRRVLTKILFAPVAYIIGHVCAMGFSTLSYSMPFDFYRIMLTALPIYFILILISSLCERKKRQA